MSANIKITGIANTRLFLKSASKKTFINANSAIRKAGFFIQKEVVNSIAGHRAEPRSVDTGYFMNSILSIQPKPLTANIGSNKYPVKYANILEFGGRGRAPRSHIRNTAKRNEKNIRDFINAEIKKI